ncbi:MAG: hypothetical protein H6Q44_1996 [Deltaproteobacteria bacterium]|nr:hypothetical protein [Deltaproteobacteria bacterium]
MRNLSGLQEYLVPILAAAFFSLSGACLYRVNLEPPVSPKVDPAKYQPLALLPIQDASGHPASGMDLYPILRDSLEKKGYNLVSEAEVASVLDEMKLASPLLLSDLDSLKKVAERLKAKLLMIATLPEYKVQKSRLGSQPVQMWDGETFTEQMLPTYFGGSSQIRLILRMFESEKGELVWMSEGTIHASRDSAETYARKLAERLLRGLPSLTPPSPK